MKSKTSVIAIIFMFIMLVSTFAIGALQASKTSTTGAAVLPGGNIVNQELTSDQESLALSRGMTVTKFYYYQGCLDCNDKLGFLEYVAKQYPSQILLEEIITDRTTSLTISSYYGERNFANATQDQIFRAYCQIMTNPPVTCAVS